MRMRGRLLLITLLVALQLATFNYLDTRVFEKCDDVITSMIALINVNKIINYKIEKIIFVVP